MPDAPREVHPADPRPSDDWPTPLSVITAVHREAVRFLPTAAASLAAQATAVDWIVCYDGDRVPPEVSAIVAAGCRAMVPGLRLLASGRQAGPSTARNMALSHVRTPWTAVLDADDTWLPGGLDLLLHTAQATDSSWTAGLTVDLHERHHVNFPDHLDTGVQKCGTVYEAYQRLGFMPFHGCAMVWRTSVLWQLGGWPALPAGEDTALALMAAEHYPGYYLGATPVYGYHRHPGQTTASPHYAARRAAAGNHHRRRISELRADTGTPCSAGTGSS
ncbi:glycosyltransferase [Streptodolium elevatio]